MADTNRKQARRRPPVRSHPLFPAFARFWFAALLGLGCLAVGPVLLDRLLLASGIGAVIADAAPPLGTGGHIALAAILAACGAVIGSIVARLVVPRNVSSGPAETGGAPIAAAWDHLLLDGSELSDLSAETAANRPPDLSELPPPAVPESPGPAPAEEPVDLDPGEPYQAADAETARFEPLAAEPEPAFEEQPAAPTPLRQSAPYPPGSAAHRITTGALEELSPVEMLERLALSMQQRERPATPAPVEPAPELEPQGGREIEAEELSLETGEFEAFEDSEDEAELADLPEQSAARRSLASLTPMAEIAQPDDEATEAAAEDEEYEAENDVREEVYSSLLRVTRPADPGMRLTPYPSGAEGDETSEDDEAQAALEPAPGGRLTKMQRLGGGN